MNAPDCSTRNARPGAAQSAPAVTRHVPPTDGGGSTSPPTWSTPTTPRSGATTSAR